MRALAALALSGLIAVAALSGCGQKGPLYLPQQKKSRVPETPSNPAPDATDTPGTPDTPSDTSSPSSDSKPHA